MTKLVYNTIIICDPPHLEAHCMPQPQPTSSSKRVIVAGHICLDIIPGFDHLPGGQFLDLLKPGKMITAGPATLSTGGAVSNTGLALVKLGIPTRLIGKIGRDPFGEAVCRIVSSYDPDLISGMVVDPDSSTSYTICLSPPGMDRMFLHWSGANETFSPSDIHYQELNQAALFHFGYPPVMRQFYQDGGAGLVEMLRRAKETGVTTSIDLTFPDPLSDSARTDWGAIFAASLPYVDIFAPSVGELLFMLHRPVFDRLSAGGDLLSQVTPVLLHDLSDEILALGAKIVMLKLGDCGAYLRTANKAVLAEMGRAAPDDLASWAQREFLAPCYRVNVVGTTGSGDATIAGFLSALLRGLPAEEALTIAVAVGACNVEASDALSGLPTWASLQERLEAGWGRLPTRIPTTGWQWQPEPGLWVSPHDRA
jgi:sugar/nucleoside kinase (ribokinase family)